MHCNTELNLIQMQTKMARKAQMIMEMCIVFRFWLIITCYLATVTHFNYLFLFVGLVSFMEYYLSTEDHFLFAQF